MAEQVSELGGFYDYLYGDREGYVHAATKEHGAEWKEFFFSWPAQRNDLVRFTETYRSRCDVYVAPAMFSQRSATKDCVIGAPFVWVEFDSPPQEVDGVPPPTCRIASGGDGHEHWYWRLTIELDGRQLDLINKALAYHLGGDPSGWDSTQVLRPPNTFNHKRKRQTEQISITDISLDPALFANVPVPPLAADTPTPDYIPPVEQVVAKYQFNDRVSKLWFEGGNDRSDALMELGYYFAEMGMVKPEILSCLMNADERWGKFKGRSDRMRRLMEIVDRAVAKYPPKTDRKMPLVVLKPIGFKSLLATEVKLEWQWETFLETKGYFLLTGPPGVGKTQFSLNAAGHMALGKSFLDRPMKRSKIGFFSLEMGLVELKHFLSQLQFSFTPEEQDILEEQLLFFPLGESLYLMEDDRVEQIIGDLKLDGIMVDSLGSATEESLSNEEIKRLFQWNDRMRQRHEIFTWYIHHHRKSQGDNRRPNKLDDVYGNRYITQNATSVACLWDAGLPNMMSYIPLKMRLAAKEPTFTIARDSRLSYVRVKKGTPITPPVSPVVPQIGPGPVPPTKAGPGQQGATQGAIAAGAWSSGPKSYADVVDETEISINLDMKGVQ